MSRAATFFTFGYWGWGSSTEVLLEVTAAVEKARGFAPPMFVDLRISRSVRAAGFNSRAFEHRAGSDRYVWMPELGNRAVRDHLPGITIDHPKEAATLLDLIIARAKKGQRVVGFCACEFPGTSRYPTCHRRKVGDLVLAEARKRRLHLEVVEWPGGKRVDREVRVTAKELDALLSGRPLAPRWSSAEIAALRGGSVITASTDDDWTHSFLTRPAKPARTKLVIPQLGFEYEDLAEALRESGPQYEPTTSGGR